MARHLSAWAYRVSCIVLLAMVQGVVANPQQPSREGVFTVSVTTDLMTDEVVATAVAAATEKRGYQFPHLSEPILAIRCRAAGSFEVFINWDTHLGDATRGGLRFDSDQAQQVDWSISSDRDATFSTTPWLMLNSLRTGRRMVAEVRRDFASTLVASFSLNGATAASNRLAGVCGIRLEERIAQATTEAEERRLRDAQRQAEIDKLPSYRELRDQLKPPREEQEAVVLPTAPLAMEAVGVLKNGPDGEPWLWPNPSKIGAVVAELTAGVRVQVSLWSDLGERRFYFVTAEAGVEGWIGADYIDLDGQE